MSSGKRTRNATLFNLLEYMNGKMLSEGNTIIVLDELYMFLSSKPSVEKIREFVKRGRKKESSVILSTQNIEDFLLPEYKEFTTPLFTLPSQRFLFSPGNVNYSEYKNMLNISEDECELLKKQSRGNCLFKCGDSSYLLNVRVPEYKSRLFGCEGGR
jgi:type IV secretory pathway VirB4 component